MNYLKTNPVLIKTYSHALTNILNDYMKSADFYDIMKYADITPVF